MLADLSSLALWMVFLAASVYVTRHLQWNAGILVASQATVSSLAALVDARLATLGAIALLAGLAVAICLGILHYVVLIAAGPGVLLMLTAVSQLILVEFWYALPELTGGSAGFLLPGNASSRGAVIVFLGVSAIAFASLHILVKSEDYRWASIRALGPHAGAVGVPGPQLFVISFAIYGATLGSVGIAASRTLGFLTVGMFGLPWALAIVMITLATGSKGRWGVPLLCGIYAIARVMLRQSVYASPFFSTSFEIAFPMFLFVLYLGQSPRGQNELRANTTID